MKPSHFVSIKDHLTNILPIAGLELPADDVLQQIKISPATLYPDPLRGTRTETAVIIGHRVELPVPLLPMLSVAVGGGDTPLRLNVTVQPKTSVLLGPCAVSFYWDSSLFIPVRKVTDAQARIEFEPDPQQDRVSFEVNECWLKYAEDEGIGFDSRVVISVPPFMIQGTDLVLGAKEAAMVFGPGMYSGVLTELGFDADFRGLFVNEAVLYWLPEIQINGYALPGLRLDIGELAIGNQGLSVNLALAWEVAFTPDGQILEDGTELLGSLFNNQWQLALANLGGQIRHNVPQAMMLRAFLRVPFFQAVFSAQFGLAYRVEDDGSSAYRSTLAIVKESTDPMFVGYTDINLSLNHFSANGFLSNEGFSINGQAGFEFSIFGFDVAMDSAVLAYSHIEGRDAFSFELRDVELGDLGLVPQATLIIEGRSLPDDDYVFENVRIVGEYRWSDLEDLIPADIPGLGLPDDARIKAEISWVKDLEDDQAATMVVVELMTEASHLDNLWGFVPDAFRPEVRSMQSFFRVVYESLDAFEADERDETQISVELLSRLELRLPSAVLDLDLPGFDVFDIRAGDEDGFITAEFRADYETNDQNETGFTTGLYIQNPIAVDVSLPGGRTAQPFIATSITKMGMQIDVSSGTSVGGRLLFEGDFEFRPLIPTGFPFADQFNALLHNVGFDQIKGSSRLSLGFTDDGFDLTLSGEFDDFGIELDVFDMLGALAGGGGPPTENEIDVDFDIGFRLIGFKIAIAKDPTADAGNEFSFSFDLTVECSMTGLPPVRARMRLSDDEFSLGITDLVIPLEIPEYPIAVSDFDQHIADASGNWTQAGLTTYTDQLDGEIETLTAGIDANDDQVEVFSLIKQRVKLEIKKILLQLIMVIHQRVGSSGQPTFQTLVYADTLVHETILGMLHFETELKLLFPAIQIKIPFDNPGGIAISGEGKFIGFAEDDPLKAIEDYSLELGLSSEYIYGRLTGGEPIPLPSFGTRYDDGSIAINSLGVGYGYSKNSFAFDFAGELILPTQLINDGDTSEALGAGVRLPRHSKVFFKIDTIVMSIGKVTVVIPLPQFDIDLRTPGVPALVWDGARSRPYWDGFEFIVKNAVHADFKRLAFSPFFGFFLLPNIKFDGDLELGDAHNGATLIVNDLFVLTGLVNGTTGIMPIPLVADPTTPYFENINANVRLMGFEINFDLTLPFPSPYPMSVIEAFGLISNPAMRLEPDSALSNIVRFELSNAYVQVPEFVVQMFPGAASIVDKRYGFTLNFGTLVTLAQSVIGSIGPALEALKNLGDRSLIDVAQTWEQLNQPFSPWDVVRALPPELRKFRLGGQMGGFSASACLVLATPEEAQSSFRTIGNSGPQGAGSSSVVPATAATPTTLSEANTVLGDLFEGALQDSDYDVNAPNSSLDGRRLVATDESNRLMEGIEFRQFGEDDLALIPSGQLAHHKPDSGGIFVGAYVRVFASQKIRFLGQLYENGSFALVSVAESKPLALKVFGIPVTLPFAGYGRLMLTGGQKRSGPWGSIRAEGGYNWTPIPGVLQIQAGKKGRPATLQLHSDGRFAITAPMNISLFNGAAAIVEGTALATHEKLEFDGRLKFAPLNPLFPGLIELNVTGSGVVNASDQSATIAHVPAPSFSFDARGTVTLLGQSFADVAVHVSDRTAAFKLAFSKPVNAGTPLEAAYPILSNCRLELAGRGTVDLRRALRPDFDLSGEGLIEVLGASIRGRGGIRAQPAKGKNGNADFFLAFMEGNLFWQGRKWLGGHVSIGSKGLKISGSTNFGIKITPTQIPGSNVNLAHLFFDVTIDGTFRLDPNGGQLQFLFKGAWTLGAGLPESGGDDNAQVVPLASNEFTFDSTYGSERPIFDISGFGFLPHTNVTIPKPDFTVSKATGAKTMVRAGKLKSNTNSSLVEFWTPLGILGFQDGVPYWPNRQTMTSSKKELYSAYKVNVDWSDVGIDFTEWSDLSISLALEQNSAGHFPLKLILRSGSQTPREIYL